MNVASEARKCPTANVLDLLHRYWRAANYLSVGQIYLLDTAAARASPQGARETAALEALGTTPGLNFIYAHLNRVIRTSTSTS